MNTELSYINKNEIKKALKGMNKGKEVKMTYLLT